MRAVKTTFYDAVSAYKVLSTEIWPLIKGALMAGHKVTLEAKPETRSSAQNRRMWAMLTDIANQVDWYGKKMTAECWKHVFTAVLHHQESVPGINGGFVVLGKSTSSMTKADMAELQDLIEAFGAERGVMFKDVEGVAFSEKP